MSKKYKCTPEAMLQLIKNQSAYPWAVVNSKTDIVVAICPNYIKAIKEHRTKKMRKNFEVFDACGVVWEVVYN